MDTRRTAALELPDRHDPPCLSLYQPTHRHYPEREQDPIRFKNLVKRLRESLESKYPKSAIGELLAPFHELASDEGFWGRTLDGLAVLGAPGGFYVYRLQRTVPELAVVADSFHTKPMLRTLQSGDRFRVLGLERRAVSLYEGNRYGVDEVELAPDVPWTMTDALGEQVTEPHLTVASYGKGAAGPPMRHGHGSRKDEIETDVERFFRVVDRAILEHHADPPLPFLLAALPEHQAVFRDVSRNTRLLEDGIDKHPDALSLEEVRARAWAVFEPRYRARLADLVETFGAAEARERGARDPADVCAAAVQGRVATALIDADRRVPGRVHPETGRMELDDLADPEVDDVLDELAEMVLDRGGEVVVVPSSDMPTDTGVAAIFRY